MNAVVQFPGPSVIQQRGREACNMEYNAKAGFRLLFKSIKDAPWYTDLAKKSVWIHLILEVSHDACQVAFAGSRIALGRGQMVTSACALADACGVSEDQARRALDYFEKEGAITRITKRGSHGYTIVTLCNFDAYQRGFNRSINADLNADNVADLECKRNSLSQKEKQANQHSTTAELENSSPADLPADYLAEDLNTEITKSIRAKSTDGVSATQPQPSKKVDQVVECQAAVDEYHRLLPNMPAVRELTDSRKTKLRNFWRKFNFTPERWSAYLGYIAENCRWMSERRPRRDGESQWKPKNFDYLITERCYLGVREGRFDD